LLERIRWEPSDEDPVARVRGSRDLALRELAGLREALAWRDSVARERDRAPFRVAGDAQLLEVARQRPRSVDELARVAGMNASVARSEGAALLERLDRVDRLPEGELEPFPQRRANGRGRPPPEVEALAERLKDVRNRRASALGIDRGTLMANAVITEIAWVHPRSLGELGEVAGIKGWQIGTSGEDLLAVLKPSRSHDSSRN
jgi:ribonuclease D